MAREARATSILPALRVSAVIFPGGASAAGPLTIPTGYTF